MRDGRRHSFALVYLDALDLIARELPAANRSSARNVLLALAEAASRRRDPDRREGDTLGQLAEYSGISVRRLRDYLQHLERLGLVAIEARHDAAGRDLPTLYVLRDAGSDVMSDRSDVRLHAQSDVTSDPTRARPSAVQEEEEEAPQPPQAGEDRLPRRPSGNRTRDRQRHERAVLAWAARRGVRPADPFGGDTILRIVRNACRGDESADELQALAQSPTWESRHVVVEGEGVLRAPVDWREEAA